MKSTIRRLKASGKSDARCRETVALHLPRGTGPADRDGVQTFCEADVKMSRRRYTDNIQEPVRNIQKVVFQLRDQRRTLHESKNKLWQITEAPRLRREAEAERKEKISSLAGGNLSLLGKVKAQGVDPGRIVEHSPFESEANSKSLDWIARELGLDSDFVEEMNKEFQKFAGGAAETVRRKEFARLLQALCPSRTLSNNDIEAWWSQMCGQTGKTRRDNLGTFQHFLTWFVRSELAT